MCLVDLDEETLEFVEALLYQSLTPTIRLPNLAQHTTQFTVCLNYKYGSGSGALRSNHCAILAYNLDKIKFCYMKADAH